MFYEVGQGATAGERAEEDLVAKAAARVEPREADEACDQESAELPSRVPEPVGHVPEATREDTGAKSLRLNRERERTIERYLRAEGERRSELGREGIYRKERERGEREQERRVARRIMPRINSSGLRSERRIRAKKKKKG